MAIVLAPCALHNLRMVGYLHKHMVTRKARADDLRAVKRIRAAARDIVSGNQRGLGQHPAATDQPHQVKKRHRTNCWALGATRRGQHRVQRREQLPDSSRRRHA